MGTPFPSVSSVFREPKGVYKDVTEYYDGVCLEESLVTLEEVSDFYRFRS